MTAPAEERRESFTATVDVRGVGSRRGTWWAIRIVPSGPHHLEARLPLATLGWWFWSVHRPNRLITVDPTTYPPEVRHRYTHTQLLIGGDSTGDRLTVWIRDCDSRRTWLLTPTPEEWASLIAGFGAELPVTVLHDTEPMR